MKTVKKVFYGISFLILLICILILVVAMNPRLSDKLSALLYGEDGYVAQESTSPVPENSELPGEGEDLESATPYPQMTPMTAPTKEPAAVVEGNDGDIPEKEEVVLNSITIKTVCPTPQISTYKEPVSVSLTVPENVAGLLGYVPVTAQMTEITRAEADTLTNELTEGETGEKLVFDQNFYPYYHMLQGQERELYRQIYANAFSTIGRFKPCEDIYSTQINRVMEAVFYDNPVLFWVDTAYTCKYDPSGKCVEINLQFNSTAQKLDQSKTTFFEKAEEILKVARTLESDYEKEKYVHDKLLSKVTYDANADLNQSAYSALVNGKTVCAGYARAFQYLMQQLEIPCFYCGGYSGENHAWNIVKLYGDYYNVDTTWDDTSPYTYDYFNRSDAEFADTHVRRSMSVNLPACNGTLYSGLEDPIEESVGDNSEGTTDDGADGSDATQGVYSAAVNNYYDTMIERIEAMGQGTASYTDFMSPDTWKKMETAYSNGNLDFRNDYLIRALQVAGADYCVITLSPEVVAENAYNITCTITVK